MKLILKRITKDVLFTQGFLEVWDDKDVKKRTFVSLELPWKNNEHQISCIPVGEYVVKKSYSEHLGYVFEVCDVPERSRILIHKGNYVEETKGCILLGRGAMFDGVRKERMITDSAYAMKLLFSLLPQSVKLFIL